MSMDDISNRLQTMEVRLAEDNTNRDGFAFSQPPGRRPINCKYINSVKLK